MRIEIRAGTEADLTLVSGLLREGARQRHFASSVEKEATSIVRSVLTNGGVPMLKRRGGLQVPCFVKAKLVVAMYEGMLASFLLVLFDEREIELHLAGTAKAYRRKGLFRALVQHELSHSLPEFRIYARCYRKSTWAVNALKGLGFALSKDGDPQEFTFVRRATSLPEASLAEDQAKQGKKRDIWDALRRWVMRLLA